jgi:hypothetical protein
MTRVFALVAAAMLSVIILLLFFGERPGEEPAAPGPDAVIEDAAEAEAPAPEIGEPAVDIAPEPDIAEDALDAGMPEGEARIEDETAAAPAPQEGVADAPDTGDDQPPQG